MRLSPSASNAASSTSTPPAMIGRAVVRQARQVDVVDAVGLQQAIAHDRQRLGGDRALGQLHRRADVADRLVGARRTERFVPAQCAIGAGELLELGADFGQRLLPALLRQLAVAEEAARAGDAADLQALALDRLEAAADDEFGGAAADVDHEPQLLGLRRLRMGDAEVDQARFLAAGHHFDRHGPARFPPAPGRPAARTAARTVLVATARTRCGGMSRMRWPKRARHSSARWRTAGVSPPLPSQAFGQAHGLAQAVDDAQLAERVARDHHVEAVGAQVDRGQQVAVLRSAAGRIGWTSGKACASIGIARAPPDA